MVSITEGPLRKMIAAGFRGRLSVGKIRRYTYTLDAKGDRIPASSKDYRFEGIREDFSAIYRVQAGIPEKDVKILVILGLTNIRPQQADKVFIKNAWHEVRQVLSVDPADASMSLQCFQIASEV